MGTLKRVIVVELCDWEALDGETRHLIEEAERVRHNAYAPYSHYHVGAALLSVNGAVYTGCNVERATYTQTTHAEQNGIDTMVAVEGRGAKIAAMAIVGGPEDVRLRLPLVLQPGASVDWSDVNPSCGHCLQCILEHCESPRTRLIQPFANGLIAITTIDDALPMRFGPQNLGITA